MEIIPPLDGRANLEDYEHEYATFDWKEVDKEFDWYTTGKVNKTGRNGAVIPAILVIIISIETTRNLFCLCIPPRSHPFIRPS